MLSRFSQWRTGIPGKQNNVLFSKAQGSLARKQELDWLTFGNATEYVPFPSSAKKSAQTRIAFYLYSFKKCPGKRIVKVQNRLTAYQPFGKMVS